MFFQLIKHFALVFDILSDIKTLHVIYEKSLIINTTTELRNGGYGQQFSDSAVMYQCSSAAIVSCESARLDC